MKLGIGINCLARRLSHWHYKHSNEKRSAPRKVISTRKSFLAAGSRGEGWGSNGSTEKPFCRVSPQRQQRVYALTAYILTFLHPAWREMTLLHLVCFIDDGRAMTLQGFYPFSLLTRHLCTTTKVQVSLRLLQPGKSQHFADLRSHTQPCTYSSSPLPTGDMF